MNQSELIAAVAGHNNVTKKEAESIIKSLGEITQAALVNGDEVTLPGLGKFTVKNRAARAGRNPATGAAMKIAAKKVPHFTAAKALKDAVA